MPTPRVSVVGVVMTTGLSVSPYSLSGNTLRSSVLISNALMSFALLRQM